MADYRIQLGVRLDTSDIATQVSRITTSERIPVNIQLNTQEVQRQIDNIRTQIRQLGNIRINLGGGGGNNNLNNNLRNVNEVTRAYRELISLQNRIGSKQQAVARLDTTKNQQEILQLSNQIDRLYERYQRLRNLFDGQFSDTQLDTLNRNFQITSENLDIINRKIADTKAKLASDIQVKVNTNAINSEISTLETKFSNLKVKTAELTNGMDAVRTASNNLNAAIQSGDINQIIAAYTTYNTILQETTNQINIATQAEKQAANARRDAAAQQKLVQDRANLSLDMSVWLKKNSAAAGEFGSRIKQLQAELKSCDSTRLSGIRSEFQSIKKEAELAGKSGLSFGDRLEKQFQRFSTYFSVSMMIMQSIRALRSMYNNVLEIDKAMTELKKVTDETEASYSKFLSNASSRAKELGTTIQGLVSSTADFARLGYSFEESQDLAEVANIYAVVGDEIDNVETATQSIISTMAAFGIEANNSISIVDKFNEVGNNFAISSGGIGEALTRSASSMVAANNTIDETIALVAAANTVVQDPDVVGRLMPTLKMAISVKLQRWTRPSKDLIVIHL